MTLSFRGSGGTADTHASGACAHYGREGSNPFFRIVSFSNIKSLLPSTNHYFSWKGGPAWYGTRLEIWQVDSVHTRVQIPSFPFLIITK